MKDTDFGTEEPVIALTVNIGDYDLVKGYLESREISKMKGSIVITDAYGDLLKNVENIEFETTGALVSHTPGLEYALGEQYLVISPRTYNLNIRINHKSNSEEFRSAVRSGKRLRIEFVPDVLLFSDGSVLK